MDKTTQDAKDASQDTSITGLDERVTALEGKDTGIINGILSASLSGTVQMSSGSATVSEDTASKYAVSVATTSVSKLNFDFDSDRLIKYDVNFKTGSQSSDADYDNYINIAPYVKTALNTWLTSLVGKQLIEASNVTYTKPSYLWVKLSGIVLTSTQNNVTDTLNEVRSAYSNTLRVTVELDDDGIITSIGSITTNNTSSGKILVCANSTLWSTDDGDFWFSESIGKITWNTQNIKVQVYPSSELAVTYQGTTIIAQ